jgi:uncharacterized membrane protein
MIFTRFTLLGDFDEVFTDMIFLETLLYMYGIKVFNININIKCKISWTEISVNNYICHFTVMMLSMYSSVIQKAFNSNQLTSGADLDL